jgi:CHAD domain-containing protein
MRSRREQKLANALDKETIRQIRKRLKRAESAVSLPGDGNLIAVASRMFAQLAREHPNLSEEVLHRYRILGKRVRYIAEVAGDLPEARRLVAELKRMQDAIGEWHDWLSLTQSAEKLWTDGRPSALLAALKNITGAKYRFAIQAVNETKTALLANAASTSKVPASVTAAKKPNTTEKVASAAMAS